MNTSILFLFGSDDLAIARRLEAIQARYDPNGLNTARLDARTASKDELNNAVNAMPFLGEKRLVFLKDPSAHSTRAPGRQKFLKFLLGAPPSTLVVLYELVEPREISEHWLLKLAGKGVLKTQAFNMPRFKEMPGWILNEVKRQGGQMEPGAAASLAEMVGEDTRLAAQEITKLLTYVNFARPVTSQDVDAAGIVSAQEDVFTLVDALCTGRGGQAQKVLHQILETEDAFAIWGMIIRQFRLLLQAREILDDHGGLNEIKQGLGVPEFVAGKVFTQAPQFSIAVLERIYHRLLEMDEKAKTGQVPLDLAMDMLVIGLSK